MKLDDRMIGNISYCALQIEILIFRLLRNATKYRIEQGGTSLAGSSVTWQ